MGLSLKGMIEGQEVTLDDLTNRVVVFDSFNILYQFLTTIRQSDGTPLKNADGVITSHLTGLFNRTVNILQKGIKPVFVFDGEAPDLKKKERERRTELKKQAQKEYEIAKQNQDIDGMKKYASRTTKLTPDMVNEAKKLLTLMGLPVIQAPSEGEAQAAHMVKKGDAYATVSQDFDTLMFASPRLVRNLSISGRRKRPGSPAYDVVKPEMIVLADNLNKIGIDGDQLIVLGILIGTDFNYGGIKGIGPAKALKLLKEHGTDYDKIFEIVKWKEHYSDLNWEDIYYALKNIPVTDDYSLEWKDLDYDGVIQFLVEDYGFSEERVKSQLDKLKKSAADKAQKGLGDFF